MPYFRTGLQSLVPREAPGLGTIGVSDRSVLMIDQEVLGEMTADEAGTVLLHEYLHIYLRHTQRYEALVRSGALSSSSEDRKLMNQAFDAEINDNLVEANCAMPKLGGEEMITPASLNLPAHRTAEEYLVELLKRRQKNNGGGGNDENKPGWGRCGSGAGNPLPDEPDAQQRAEDPEGRSEVEQHIQRKQDSESIQQAARSNSRGNVPAGLARAANAMLAPAEIPWTEKLARSARQAVAHVLGMGDFTFTQRARMQGSLEASYGDEAPVLPGEHSPRAEILIAVDTSGSIGDAQLKKVLEEANAILRNMGGAKITFVSIDAEIHTLKRVHTVQEISAGLAGGGGTDFRPVFELLPKLKPRPNIVAFFTDLYGPYPKEPPPGVHTIWVVVDSDAPDPAWGETIRVRSKANSEAA
jgi:predicted metal-dependent peptidase